MSDWPVYETYDDAHLKSSILWTTDFQNKKQATTNPLNMKNILW